ncbi:MAG: DNA repair and recombination protein RadB [Nanoarchaeota archaeon]|nr:DNA repair and recombination protein RadB [Nanoarchaeota archaeon]
MQNLKFRKISSGNYDLNKFLYGGYDVDIITTIYGPAGTGKTNFCLMAAVSQAKKESKVIFIDTEGGFSIERFKQLAGEDYEKFLKNIILLKAVKFEEQKKIFSKLLKEIKSKGKIGLIVVDGMAMLYRLELAEAGKIKEGNKVQEVNQELAKQMRILAEISRNMNIPVIVTNQGYSEFLSKEDFEKGKQKEFQMVGGDILKYWSKCIIEMQNNKGKRKIIIKKHRSLPEKELSFFITNEGIKKSFRLF